MDPITLFLILALAGFVVFQVFQGRKRKRETEERVSQFVPGVEIMTNYGLYGTIVEVDDDKNLVTLELSPGVEVKIHKQTMLKVADYNDVPSDDEIDDETSDDDADVVSETELDTDADIRTGDNADKAATPKNTATTPAFSAATPAVTEPAPAYGERIVAKPEPTELSSETTAPAAVEPTPESAAAPRRAPRKPKTPRVTPTRNTAPRADESSSDASSN